MCIEQCVCSVQRAVKSVSNVNRLVVQYAVISVPCVICNMQCVMNSFRCSVQCAVYTEESAVCIEQCVCSVQ